MSRTIGNETEVSYKNRRHQSLLSLCREIEKQLDVSRFLSKGLITSMDYIESMSEVVCVLKGMPSARKTSRKTERNFMTISFHRLEVKGCSQSMFLRYILGFWVQVVPVAAFAIGGRITA